MGEAMPPAPPPAATMAADPALLLPFGLNVVPSATLGAPSEGGGLGLGAPAVP